MYLLFVEYENGYRVTTRLGEIEHDEALTIAHTISMRPNIEYVSLYRNEARVTSYEGPRAHRRTYIQTVREGGDTWS
jgi:hypothetical protein